MDTAYESQPAAAKEKYLWTLSAKCTDPADWPTQAGENDCNSLGMR